ncbi:MAG: hypothetical protein PVS2B3_01010 [Steroidobacteraceae bacterium]
MRPVTGVLAALAAGVLTGTAWAHAAAPATAGFVPLAHSAQLSVDAAAPAPDTLTLRIRRGTTLATPATTQVEVAAQGRSLPVTANTDGTWNVTLKELAGKPPGRLDLVVSHDGIRELLSGTPPAPLAGTAPASATGLLGHHKQLAWWILNIVIVLIAAIAISRRMS